ncbi:hypothetical protein ACFOGJ_08630 [Marinibaculum pumilum]|uniref:PH domain-containing protein n=1 Tax=Marinibaculum pumilum TaxID=1766165 RepID=A0ABV7KYA8_9PROT
MPGQIPGADRGPQDEAAAGSRHAYPAEGVWGEAARALVGLALGLGLMLISPAGGTVFLAGAALALLFAAFAAAVWRRRGTVVTLDRDGLTLATGLPAGLPFGLSGRRLDWSDLRGMSLRYFSTRRDRSGGWMQLTLKGRAGRLTMLSTISGFPRIARQAEAAARRNGLALGIATERNLLALGEGLERRPPA